MRKNIWNSIYLRALKYYIKKYKKYKKNIKILYKNIKKYHIKII
jgi:hypothetical protein